MDTQSKARAGRSPTAFPSVVRAAPEAQPVLAVQDLKTYVFSRDGDRVVKAVDGVSFTLGRGETLAIVGESGSGKSMTALSIMRLLPPGARTIAGRIGFNGEDLLQKTEAEMQAVRGGRIGMILQDPMVSLDPLYTIGSQMAEPLRFHLGMSGAPAHGRTLELLDSVGIPEPAARLGQYPHQMSGGMLQRIVGAIGISCDPELLIADEPTTALDMTVQAQFLDLLEELRERQNLSLIVVTHDFGVAARLCDQVMVMYAGRVVERAPVREIFDRPRHPYTRALLSSIPRSGGTSGRLPTIEGQPPDAASLPAGCAFAPRCAFAIDACRRENPAESWVGENHVARCLRVNEI